MTTIPSRLATLTKSSSSLAEARTRSLQAYRQWYRSAPEIVSLYALNVSPSMIRLKKRQDFEKNRNITDLGVIDILLFKNQQEYQETMNCWKQEPHLMQWFKQYDDPPQPVTFLDKFYAGRDEPKQVGSF
ncbi:NADH dehydrogenase (ubiquinone) 1 alpha subcomplex subunit 6, partial [Tremellales sp. Uapishka_1]